MSSPHNIADNVSEAVADAVARHVLEGTPLDELAARFAVTRDALEVGLRLVRERCITAGADFKTLCDPFAPPPEDPRHARHAIRIARLDHLYLEAFRGLARSHQRPTRTRVHERQTGPKPREREWTREVEGPGDPRWITAGVSAIKASHLLDFGREQTSSGTIQSPATATTEKPYAMSDQEQAWMFTRCITERYAQMLDEEEEQEIAQEEALAREEEEKYHGPRQPEPWEQPPPQAAIPMPKIPRPRETLEARGDQARLPPLPLCFYFFPEIGIDWRFRPTRHVVADPVLIDFYQKRKAYDPAHPRFFSPLTAQEITSLDAPATQEEIAACRKKYDFYLKHLPPRHHRRAIWDLIHWERYRGYVHPPIKPYELEIANHTLVLPEGYTLPDEFTRR